MFRLPANIQKLVLSYVGDDVKYIFNKCGLPLVKLGKTMYSFLKQIRRPINQIIQSDHIDVIKFYFDNCRVKHHHYIKLYKHHKYIFRNIKVNYDLALVLYKTVIVPDEDLDMIEYWSSKKLSYFPVGTYKYLTYKNEQTVLFVYRFFEENISKYFYHMYRNKNKNAQALFIKHASLDQIQKIVTPDSIYHMFIACFPNIKLVRKLLILYPAYSYIVIINHVLMCDFSHNSVAAALELFAYCDENEKKSISDICKLVVPKWKCYLKY